VSLLLLLPKLQKDFALLQEIQNEVDELRLITNFLKREKFNVFFFFKNSSQKS
jgi:hypothetical protein